MQHPFLCRLGLHQWNTWESRDENIHIRICKVDAIEETERHTFIELTETCSRCGGTGKEENVGGYGNNPIYTSETCSGCNGSGYDRKYKKCRICELEVQ